MFTLFKTVNFNVRFGIDRFTNLIGVFDTLDLAKAAAEEDAVKMGHRDDLTWDGNKVVFKVMAVTTKFEAIEVALNTVIPEGGANVADVQFFE